MLAIGILAVGLAMSMSVFPAAVKQNETSFGNVLGSLIAENGLTVAELEFRRRGLNPVSMTDYTDTIDPDSGSETYLTRYPFKETANGQTKGHWRVLANDDVLIVIAYRDYRYKDSENNPVPPAPAAMSGSSIDGTDKALLINADSGLAAGTFVIDQDGNYARIISTKEGSTTSYRLDRDIHNSTGPFWKAKDAIAVRSMAISN